MSFEKFLISFSPVVIFYLIYFRYFSSMGTAVTKYLTALLTGVAYALFLILVSASISEMVYIVNPVMRGFVTAGIIEKAGAIIVIYVLLRKFPEFGIPEGIITGMFFGLGFSCIENFFYAAELENSIIYIRMIFSVPLHITTCGIAGFYLGIGKLSWSLLNSISFRIKSFIIPLLFHGSFDAALMKGGVYSYISAPVLILSVTLLEVVLARSQSFYPENKLKVMGMNFEEWMCKDRQPRYDRWVKRYTGILKSSPAPFFNWNPGFFRFSFFIIMILLASAGMTIYRNLNQQYNLPILREEAVAVFVLFPLCIALVLIISGAVNPMYFVKSLIRLPIISDVEIVKDGLIDEYLVTNDVTSGNCFVQSTESFGIGKSIELRFRISGVESGVVKGKVIWENHTLRHEPFGSIVRITSRYRGFFIFIIKYNLLRYWKGAVFLFKLPGFDQIKAFFYKPLVISQEEEVYPAGSIVFREGDTGDKFYLIKKGRIIFYKQKENEEIITVHTSIAGEFFGELAVLGDEKTRNATAMCTTDVVLAVATRDNLDALLTNNAEFAIDLLETLTNRVILSEKIFFQKIQQLEEVRTDNERLMHISVMLMLIGLGFDPSRRGLDMNIDAKRIRNFVRKMDDLGAAQMADLFITRQTILKEGGEPRNDEVFMNKVQQIFSDPSLDEDETD
ncbi:MAG TPA: cyclic nucleotide-binding domain-containing protein [Spirochaetota bacterium]|nr:cyclic nucleotide-binding domain-containing protein [Spirochaetota bacterium]